MTIHEVIQGLQQGKSFTHGEEWEKQTLVPIGDGEARLYTSGSKTAGNVVQISELRNGYWEPDGWMEEFG